VAALPGDAAPTPALKPAASRDGTASQSRDAAAGNAVAKGKAAEKDKAADEVKTPGAGTLVITFPTNSSYFPPETPEQLQKLVAGLEGQQPLEVVLQAAVSGSDQVVGANSLEEAARYNQWMAERRLERVEKWLLENLGEGRVTIEPEYLANDDSRRVVVRLGAAG
jgi:hypothetical protein